MSSLINLQDSQRQGKQQMLSNLFWSVQVCRKSQNHQLKSSVLRCQANLFLLCQSGRKAPSLTVLVLQGYQLLMLSSLAQPPATSPTRLQSRLKAVVTAQTEARDLREVRSLP